MSRHILYVAMSNNYGLPEDKVDEVRARDKTCVYCHKSMTDPKDRGSRTDWATIEHLNHLPPWDNPSTIAICCASCNSSRSDKRISDWFKTQYCIERNINLETVAEPVRKYINKYEK